MPRIGPSHGAPPAVVADGVAAGRRALVDDDDLDLDALRGAAARDSASIRGASSGTSDPRWRRRRPAPGVSSSPAPITPTLTPLTRNTFDGVTQAGASPVAVVDDVRGQEREVGPRLVLEQPLDAVVELVVAVRRGVQAPGVLDVDGGLVLRAAPSWAARRRRCRRRPGSGPGPGSAASSSSNIVARNAAPPTAGVDRRRRRRVVGSSWPWKSLSPTIDTGVYRLPPLTTSSSTRPWLCCGSGMPSRNASVGARSIERALTVPCAMPRPPARNVARMLTLAPRSWTSGT